MDSTDRHIMWKMFLGESYDNLNPQEKKKARHKYADDMGMKPGDFNPAFYLYSQSEPIVVNSSNVGNPTPIGFFPSPTTTFSSNALKLGTLPTGTVVGTFYDPVNNLYDFLRLVTTEKKEETTMENLIQDTKRHLSRRVEQVRFNKRQDFYKTFYIYDNACPDTIEEALERIAKGQYTVAPKNEDYDFSEWTHRLHWRDPAHPADQAGFDAANSRMNTAFQRAYDDIQVLTPEEGLKALREFEDTDFAKN